MDLPSADGQASRCVVLKPKLATCSEAFAWYVIAHEFAHAFLRNGGWGEIKDREEAADAVIGERNRIDVDGQETVAGKVGSVGERGVQTHEVKLCSQSELVGMAIAILYGDAFGSCLAEPAERLVADDGTSLQVHNRLKDGSDPVRTERSLKHPLDEGRGQQ